MKRFSWLIAITLAALAVGVTGSFAATTPTNFTLKTTLDGRDQAGGCCTASIDATGTGSFPRIGRATVAARYFRCPRVYYCSQPAGDSHLSMTFTTPAGYTLTLVGNGDDTGSGTWQLGSSTGRFARANGSGTYSVTYTYTGVYDPPYAGVKLSVTLNGNLSFGSTS